MIRCPKCGKKMNTVMHFEKGSNYAYHSCSSCIIHTHRKRIHYEDFQDEYLTTQNYYGGKNGKQNQNK